MGDKSRTDFEGCITHGPWGGSGGKSWIYNPKGFIKKIVVVHGTFVLGIKFFSVKTESSHVGGKHGYQTATDEIFIDYPNEYLTSISGTVGGNGGVDVVMSLCFGTNLNHYGPYGTKYGTPFSYEGEGVMIVGFHGRATASKYLHSVGVYVMPKSVSFGHNSTSSDNSTHEVCPRMAMPREAGPWGAFAGGTPWDDGVFSAVKKVHVHVGESLNVIYAIQVEYVESNSKSILSPVHGGTNGDKMELVNLDSSDEYLIGISGFYGHVEGLEAITSITFYTNKRTHGPYGAKSGAGYTYFASAASPGKIVGFYGRKDCFLTAIGVHMKYF